MAATTGATVNLVPAKSRAGIASTATTWAAITVSTAIVLSATATDHAVSCVSAIPAAAVDSATEGVAISETSKESSLAHPCYHWRWHSLSLHHLHCVGVRAAKDADNNYDDERTGSHTTGNGECDLYCACNSRPYSDSNTKTNANANTIADFGTNSDTSADTDHCSAGPANSETSTEINAKAV